MGDRDKDNRDMDKDKERQGKKGGPRRPRGAPVFGHGACSLRYESKEWRCVCGGKFHDRSSYSLKSSRGFDRIIQPRFYVEARDASHFVTQIASSQRLDLNSVHGSVAPVLWSIF